LDRNISGAGLMDTHGRGVYLMHRLVDRVLINIAPGQRTEIIILDYFNSTPNLNKPIYINQL
jgi:anti-sigma regulatory factor (Ser/Thr protein kinase)